MNQPEYIPGLAQITTDFASSMAPSGHDTFWFWSGLVPFAPKDGWEVARDVLTDRLVKNVGEYFEGIEEMEISRRVLASPDIETWGGR
ncbi:MAG: hypothetical protein QM599_08140 [Pseudoxanthomonas sp.]